MEISRRSLLKSGGGPRPGSARSARSRRRGRGTASQSVAGGKLETLPPEDVWDAAADAVVRRLFEEEGITRIERAQRAPAPLAPNDQPLPDRPAGRPRRLHRGGEAASRRGSTAPSSPPASTSTSCRGNYTGLLYGLGSGIMSCAIPDEARAVYHSKGGEDMRDRVAKTAKLGYDVGTENAFDPGGEMIVTCIKTRLTHSAVRHLITSSPRWQAGGDIPAPISQRDLIITWHSLATFIHRTLGAGTCAHRRPRRRLPPRVAGDGALPRRPGRLHPGHLDRRPATSPTRRSTPSSPRRPRASSSAETLLSLLAEYDQGASRPALNAMARYMVGTNKAGQSIGDMLQIPNALLGPGRRRAGRGSSPSASRAPIPGTNGYWTFDELLRLGVLWGPTKDPARSTSRCRRRTAPRLPTAIRRLVGGRTEAPARPAESRTTWSPPTPGAVPRRGLAVGSAGWMEMGCATACGRATPWFSPACSTCCSRQPRPTLAAPRGHVSSGYCTSATQLGLPDFGYLTQTEIAEVAAVCAASSPTAR